MSQIVYIFFYSTEPQNHRSKSDLKNHLTFCPIPSFFKRCIWKNKNKRCIWYSLNSKIWNEETDIKNTELIHTDLSLVHIFNEFMFNFMNILREWNRFDFNLKLNWGKKPKQKVNFFPHLCFFFKNVIKSFMETFAQRMLASLRHTLTFLSHKGKIQDKNTEYIFQ